MHGNDIKETINHHTFWMKYIPEGTFDMGDEYGDLGSSAQPIQKRIKIDAFHLAKYPVTQALWKAVMEEDNNPSEFKGDKRPVENVSWDDAQQFLAKLNNTDKGKQRYAVDGLQYRLPFEAQWEYAARGGKNIPNERYAGSANLKEVGWYGESSHRETNPVGLKLANALGLYDMSGNVWEWCEDAWLNTLDGMPKDGLHRKKGDENLRVLRGGSWSDFDYFCRVAFRLRLSSDERLNYFGFRLARY